MNNKYTIIELQNHIEQNKLITTDVQKVFTNIKKHIEKGKDLKEIQQYIDEKVLTNCCMCENEKAITSTYSEGNFVPLAISSENMKNFFWNQNAKFPLCDMCKLILFCIPAGITEISKTVKENGTYKEKEIINFVNYDTDVETLLLTNNSFNQNSKKDITIRNPYADMILNIVEQDKSLSEWQLENIFVIEFETEYLGFSRMEYFNITKYIAKFFQKYSQLLTGITDYQYKLQIVDNILKNKETKYIINERLMEELKKGTNYAYNSFFATKIRNTLNLLKKEGKDVEIKNGNSKLTVLYNIGIEIHEELKKNNEESKLNGYIYKMLNSVKLGNKKDFMDIVIRIHMMMGKDVSPIFLDVVKEDVLDFESIAHSFISGLISNKYEKKENNEGGQ
jgi:CRISPR-associated protein Cst1